MDDCSSRLLRVRVPDLREVRTFTALRTKARRLDSSRTTSDDSGVCVCLSAVAFRIIFVEECLEELKKNLFPEKREIVSKSTAVRYTTFVSFESDVQ